MRQWTSLEGLESLTRVQVLDANDVLDALDEAEFIRSEKEKAKQK